MHPSDCLTLLLQLSFLDPLPLAIPFPVTQSLSAQICGFGLSMLMDGSEDDDKPVLRRTNENASIDR